MTTTLVLGAAGQIGSDLVPALAAAGHDLWMSDLRPPGPETAEALTAAFGSERAWKERWRTANAATPDIAALVAQIRPRVVFHLAAILSANGEKDPRRCWDVNMDALRLVLDALAADVHRPTLVWPSSIAAFGPLPAGLPAPERVPNEHPLLPTTMYGVTKVAGELLGAYYAARLGVDFRSLRFPGLLSAVEPGGGSSDFANAMYFAAARGERAVQVFVREDTRIPFLHMDDAVSALLQLAAAPEERLTRRTYNVSGFAPTAGEIAASIRRAGRPLEVTYVPDHRQAIVDSWPDDLDDRAARADWGWQPAYDLDKTTTKLLADIR